MIHNTWMWTLELGTVGFKSFLYQLCDLSQLAIPELSFLTKNSFLLIGTQ